MADLKSVRLHIAGIGHIFYAPVGTEVPDISKFVFGNESTYGDFKWLGDISSENVVEFEPDGGDASFKRTHDRLNVRAIYEDQTIQGTINALSISKETFEVAFGEGGYQQDTDSYKVKAKAFSANYALLLVTEDGVDIAAVSFPNASVTGTFPTFDIENFTELPLKASLQGAEDNTLWEQFFPRPYNAGVQVI